jgi:5'-3' exonuclease
MYEHMVIDTRNAIYRAIYANLSDRNNQDIEDIVILFRFISSYIHRLKPKNIHFIWDCPKAQVWRKRVLPEYKEGRDLTHDGKHEQGGIDESLVRCTTVLGEMIPHLNARSYAVEKQEADDLIYAFCKQMNASKTIIISSDGDFKQIPYHFKNVSLFNPLAKDKQLFEHGMDDLDVVELKCFMGERADNIHGYYQIGPVRAKVLVDDLKKRSEFFKENDTEIYLRNRALIDLSLCPYLLKNMYYITEIISEEPKFDQTALRGIIQKYKVRGLLGEYTRVILPFKLNLACGGE